VAFASEGLDDTSFKRIVLSGIRDLLSQSVFHQYLDQTADPEFASLFETYRRTSATEKRRSVVSEMQNLISLRFVEVRRNQIRGYGYDEFAIFAELVQNAEDAYSQREQLELPPPPDRAVRFTYSLDMANGSRSLSVRHYGRPFNLWRHRAKRIDAFRYDVEGVLKSAGSFKPHTKEDGVKPIGRFGLGFKSVYLVTDAPRIHSGDWHFEISAGCIPKEIAVPIGYERGQTHILLPLTVGAREEHDGESLIVIRKGATPAFPGQKGFVGGSMGDDAVIVQGTNAKNNRTETLQRNALFSTVHGAGRVMSRSAAAGKTNRRTGRVIRPGAVSPQMMQTWVRQKGVILRGGGLDESPHVYRRLPEVLAAQKDTIQVLHTLRPLVVVMAGADLFDPYKD